MSSPSTRAVLSAALSALSTGEEEHAQSLLALAEVWSGRDLVRECTACALSESRTNAVPWEGAGGPVMMVGEAPGAREDELGRPFVGRSGVLLESLARQAGLVRGVSSVEPGMVGYSLANLVCCRPPGNDFDLAVRADAPMRCRPHLRRALESSGAWLVVLVGSKAFEHLGPGGTASSRRGRFWVGRDDNRLYTTVYHPAYLLRNPAPEFRKSTVQAFERVATLVTWGQQPSTPTPGFSMVPLTDRPAEFDRLHKHYAKRGWVVFRSGVLDRSVVVWKGEGEGVRVPDEFNHLIRFTPTEVARMRGRPEVLRRVAMVKEIGAEVVA